jgi:hypothetical protein
MKKKLAMLLFAVAILTASCNYNNYQLNDLRGYHFGKGQHYNGKYHGARYKYNWEKKVYP